MEVFHTESLFEREFDQILSVLRAGGVIGFPTDTAYGLGADPFNLRAVSQIFMIKGRPETKPILLLVDSLEMMERIAAPHPTVERVARAFWPGPLTIVMPAHRDIPATITAGTGTVGVRWPVAPFATDLVRRLGSPITATSANRSGQPSCVTASEVRSQLETSLPILVDGGPLPARGGSTLLDLTSETPTMLREGPISFEALDAFFDGNLREIRTMIVKALKWGILLITIGIMVLAGYWGYLYRQIRNVAVIDEAQKADAIVILGAAQYNGHPSPVFKARLDHALELFNKGYAHSMITTGGYGPDPNFSEAHVGTQYLVQHGVDPSLIITEQGSGNTSDSIEAVSGLLQAHGWKAALVVSDGFHLYRLKRMFADRGIFAYTSPAPNSPIETGSSQRLFYSMREVLLFSAYRLTN